MTGAASSSVPVVASDWLRPVLDAAADGHVVGVGPRAAYIEVAGTVVAVEAHDAVGLPCGLRLPAPHAGVLDRITPNAPVTVAAGTVTIGATTLQVARWWRAVPASRPGATTVPDALVASLMAGLDRLPDRLATGATAIAQWLTGGLAGGRAAIAGRSATEPAGIATDAVGIAIDPAGIVADLVGWGPGSTPSGDDLLAGVLATLVVARVPTDVDARRAALATAVLHRAPGVTTALSATLLACAVDGAMALPAAAFLQALTPSTVAVTTDCRAEARRAGDGHVVAGAPAVDDRVQAAFDRLARIGHTSGRDLALGILTGLRVVAHATQPTTDLPRPATSF